MPSANQIAFLFFLFSFISFSQTKEIDSLFRYSRYSDLEVLLFERNYLQRDDLYLAQSRYFNTFNQLEETFESLYAIDTTDLSPRQKAHYYNNLADAYDLNSNFDLAARNFVQAQNYYKKVGDMLSYNDINLDLFYTVANPDIYNEPVDYLDAFQELALELEDPLQLVSLEMELAFESLETQDSTAIFLEHIDKAYDLLEKDYDAYKLGIVHTFHAFYYTDVIIDKDSASTYYSKAIEINKELGLPHKVALGYFSLGDLNRYTGDYEEAIAWTKKANSYRNFNYDFELTAYINQKLAEDYKNLSQLDSAYFYLDESLKYRDSLNIQKQNISLTRFEAEKKERQNLILEKENQRNEAFIVGSLGALVLLSFLSFSVYISAKRKRLLIEKDKALEIRNIESQLKKQQLKALDALVIGQEKERMRIASDLHDNIGSNFMAIKSYFDHLRKEFKSSENTSPVFEKTHDLLEETYQDIRSLAHLKHSGSMKDSGLVPALKKLSKNVSSFSQIEVDFNSFIDDEVKLNEKLELNVFRIIQETMANVVKHSKAKKASVSITNIDSLLNIIVEDDGVGFDEDKVAHQDSFGLQSIKERIQLLNGEFKIDTKKGRGTTLIIDIPI
ncbi:sensor histidine kinase [Psychroflexus montanilacus]|uniref:sensor histidine kinase n=1 Tax=Psychroflexus montanilacus TaxID=2873598 RepID=UPI001CCA3A6E|nr:sensor histidine kinase [Psychroflexus montanilacus]MBZ9651944.1 sensor histidine kinase [Psychroflexus montanilacus]